ncbi:hypothetical protein PO909_006967 [Leuciscus waleckii]
MRLRRLVLVDFAYRGPGFVRGEDMRKKTDTLRDGKHNRLSVPCSTDWTRPFIVVVVPGVFPCLFLCSPCCLDLPVFVVFSWIPALFTDSSCTHEGLPLDHRTSTCCPPRSLRHPAISVCVCPPVPLCWRSSLCCVSDPLSVFNKERCCIYILSVTAVAGREAARLLADLRQGNGSVSEYSIRFRTLAAECRWNEEARWDHFLHGLADRVQREIYMLDLPRSLNGLIELALRVDARLSRMGRLKQNPPFRGMENPRLENLDTVSPVCDPGPMQEEAVNLSNVPGEYQDLREVFSKSRAASLPPHRPYDCAIDLVPAGAGFFFVGKKDGSLRPCIDYRGLNNITVKNTYPLPLMSSAFERLQGASIFTKLDLRNAYHLVRIRKGDEWKTAFNTPRGHFEYLVMPFGLSNSPAVFQALVNDVLRDMVDQFIYVYLDDILIFSSSLQEHVQHVRRVLQRLLENWLFVKAEKCVFHAQSVPFLGHIVSSEGMRMDPDKVKAVIDWPSPDSRKALQRFLGFANFYRRFIRNFSQLAAPLTALTSPRTTFRWSDTAEAVFAKLKSRFVSAPILVAPDPSRQFVVEVDASEVGVGAVLSQRSSTDDKMHPCAFFSHRLSPAERNYDIGNRELLAVKLALEEWRHWLEGSGVPFIVWTDHKNLEYIRTAKRLNSWQARWALFFGRFDFSLSYRPGSKNIKPDSLSRIFDQSERPSTPECILPETLVVSTLRWEVESKVLKALEEVTPPPDCPPNRLFVPEECRSDVIQWGHCSSIACHPGVNRTSFLVKQRFGWPLMARDIRSFVLACSVCATGKTSNRPPDG